MSNKLQPFERFSITQALFSEQVSLHNHLDKTLPQERSCDDLPFYDWEANALKRTLKLLEGDKEATCLVIAMMKLVDDDVRRQHLEQAAKLIPKPPRANTAGMFFAANVPLSEQSNCASV